MKKWIEFLPEAERRHLAQPRFQGETRLRPNAALIVVDVTMGFCGSEGLSMEEAVKEFSTACGPMSWETMPRIAELIGLFRAQKKPIVYTRADIEGNLFAGGATKTPSRGRPKPGYNDFPAAIAPRDDDWVLHKTKASGFFQTPLAAALARLQTDTVVICGVSTSGCVRATAVDSHSNGYATVVVDDCCFDRSYFAHCANLYDLQAKYANVVSLAEIKPQMQVLAAAQ
jgi:maleamate amidohydrolase